jgi:nucleotide-binding universal stress UspA family protein
MGPIVCVTRGGEASLRTQERAIQLACEHKAALIFLFVADPGFIEPVGDELAAALADELKRLGNQLLCIAQSRACVHKVDAEVVVRHGPARQTIEDFLREVNASALVLGVPHTDLGAQTFASSRAPQSFVQEIRSTNGVDILLVE